MTVSRNETSLYNKHQYFFSQFKICATSQYKQATTWDFFQVLVSSPRTKEASHQRSSNSCSGNLAGVSGPRSTKCHQRGLQELRQNHPECERPWTLRFRGCTGPHNAIIFNHIQFLQSFMQSSTLYITDWSTTYYLKLHNEFTQASGSVIERISYFIFFTSLLSYGFVQQEHIYKLMKSDSYSRFIRSSAYQELLQAKKKVKKTPKKTLPDTKYWINV